GAGARTNARITLADSYGVTALMLASLNGHAAVVRLLLAHGADVNARDNLGQTALTKAIQYGNAEAVTLLKAAGGKE
ncbi:MAG TPA: ankyrin repeat domain-containing protein, partial [Spirochaetota bacterium]|nr:ankyrin repeat domain-containing protein [Spirochaetota bacterium]